MRRCGRDTALVDRRDDSGPLLLVTVILSAVNRASLGAAMRALRANRLMTAHQCVNVPRYCGAFWLFVPTG